MFIIVPKQRPQAPPARPANTDPTVPAVSTNDDDKGPVRTATACDSCRVRKTKVSLTHAASLSPHRIASEAAAIPLPSSPARLCSHGDALQCNGQRPCDPCQRKHIICVFSRRKERHLPISPAQATLLQHQQRRLRMAVQKMAAIIAKHEQGIDAEPSTFDVLDQLARYAPTEIVDEDSCEEAIDATVRLNSHPETLQTRKRRRHDDTSTSTNSSEQDQAPAPAPAFDLVPNPTLQPDAGSHASGPSPAFDTMLHFMQFMQFMQNGQRAPTPSAQPAVDFANPHMSDPVDGTTLASSHSQAITAGPGNLSTTVPLQQDLMAFDFTNLIDWETSLANF